MATLYPPYVIERSSRGERSYDIFSRLLMDRIVFLGAPINDDVANIIIAQLLFLEADNPERDIYLYINSPGGVVSSGLAIYDTMQYLKAPVNTICMGMAASMGSFLLAAGSKGKRSALPHSRIMIHQPSGGAQGTAADIEIQAREILYLRAKLNGLYSPAYRPADRDHRAGHGPGPLHERRGGPGVRPHRQRDHPSGPRSSRRSRRPLTGLGGRGRLPALPLSLSDHGPRAHVERQAPPLLLLREVEGLGPEVHLRPVGLYLQRVHHPLQ